MGMTGLVLSSILKTDQGDQGVIDFKDVDPRFGTLADFKELSDKAKDKGEHPPRSVAGREDVE